MQNKKTGNTASRNTIKQLHGDLNLRINQKINDTGYQPIMPFPKKNLLIEVTNICNNKCIFCANRIMERNRKFIDAALVEKILTEAYELGTREVGFYVAGEPLLDKNLEKYIARAKEIGYTYIYITTNGILANLERVKSLYLSGLNSLKYSINAITVPDYEFIHGTKFFNVVMDNLISVNTWKKENDIKMKLFVSYVATRYTIEDKRKIEDYFKDKCDEIIIVPARNQGGWIPKIESQLSCDTEKTSITNKFKPPCNYPFNSIIVTCEGYLSACCMDFQNYLAYADLNKISLEKAWNNNVIQKFRKQQLDNNIIDTLCQNCIYNCNNKPSPLVEKLCSKIDYQTVVKDVDMKKRIKNYLNNKIALNISSKIEDFSKREV